MLLSIVIPAYNEEKRIAQTLEGYTRFYSAAVAEIIVILNGCRDNTIGVVKSFRKKFPTQISYEVIEEAIGKGGAVRQGFKRASGQLIGFVDADGSTDPQEFDKLVRQIDGCDGAIASRWKRGSEVINRRFFRRVVSWGFVFVVRLLFWLPFVDTQCGAKVFKKGLIDALLPRLRVNNMAFDVELLFLARRGGWRITEIPSRWVDKSSSALLGSPWNIVRNSVKMFFTLLSIRLRK